jgi:hypothetical protein
VPDASPNAARRLRITLVGSILLAIVLANLVSGWLTAITPPGVWTNVLPYLLTFVFVGVALMYVYRSARRGPG